MRKFIILRGLPGCGKSTFIKENNLENFTVSSDAVRMLYASLSMNLDGSMAISQKEDKLVWERIAEILETRFTAGLFTVFDATNINISSVNSLKQIAYKYRYKVYCVDMTDISLETVKKRNSLREEEKKVPEFVIDRMYNKLRTSVLPADIKVVKPDKFNSVFDTPEDLSFYNKIHIFGDIHGCYDILMKAIPEGFKENEYYIFCGDYLDRGIQNGEVLSFLISNLDKKNVCYLEGNHERHLRNYVNNEEIRSLIFKEKTLPEILKANVSQKKINRFLSSLKEYKYFTYNGQKVFVCHGGISKMPERIEYLSSEQIVKGVGRYTDCEIIEEAFYKNNPDIIMVHGHRNVNKENIHPTGNCYNLENGVEFGGALRSVIFSKEGVNTMEYVNTVFEHKNNTDNIEELINDLRNNEYVNEKIQGDISSFNFSRKAFQKGIWDKQTITARGLFIDTKENKIVAKSYNKFFRIGEMEETQMSELKKKFKFPLDIYKKENGFLGIFSSYNGFPFMTTKSSIEGQYSGYFKTLMKEVYGEEVINKLNIFCNQNDCTCVFEVIDTVNDPHIIRYNKNKVILLDVIYNTVKFTKMPYKQLQELASELGLEVKTKVTTIYTFKDFEKFYIGVSMSNDNSYIKEDVEGYVIEDANGFMIKLKTFYYSFWKHMRSITYAVMKHGKYKGEENITDRFEREFYDWLINEYNSGIRFNGNEIISIREKFLKELKNM